MCEEVWGGYQPQLWRYDVIFTPQIWPQLQKIYKIIMIYHYSDFAWNTDALGVTCSVYDYFLARVYLKKPVFCGVNSESNASH